MHLGLRCGVAEGERGGRRGELGGARDIPPYILGELDRGNKVRVGSSKGVGGCKEGGKEVEGGGGGGGGNKVDDAEAVAPKKKPHVSIHP